IVYGSVRESQERRYYEEHAEPMVGWIVQANPALYDRGAIDRPAQILVAFDGDPAKPDAEIAEMAMRAAGLKQLVPEDPAEAEVSLLVADETYRPFERFKLPKRFTGGRKVYSMHVWVVRALLPDGVLRHPFVRCLVLRDEEKRRPRMMPYKRSDD